MSRDDTAGASASDDGAGPGSRAEWRVVTNSRHSTDRGSAHAAHAASCASDGGDNARGSRRSSSSAPSFVPAPAAGASGADVVTNAFAVIAPPQTPDRALARDERRKAKRRRRRRRRAALRVLGGASTCDDDEFDDEEDEDDDEDGAGEYGDGDGFGAWRRVEHVRAFGVAALAKVAARGRPPLPKSGAKTLMSPPKPRTPKAMVTTGMETVSPKTPVTPATRKGRHGVDRGVFTDRESAARGMRSAVEWALYQLDIAFASVVLALYGVWDTVAKFVGIKILRLSQSSRSVRSVEARVAQERAATGETSTDADFRTRASTPSASDAERDGRREPTPSTSNTTTSTATANNDASGHKTAVDRADSLRQRLAEEREEGELTPSHAIRRRFNASLGGAWGGGGAAPPSFRVARVHEDATHAHNELISCVGQRGDSYITGGWDGTVRTWKWDPHIGLSGGAPMTGQHNDNVEFLSVDDRASSDEHIAVSGGRDCTVRVWDVKKRTQRSRIYAFENIASGCVDWPSSTVAVGSRGGVVALWDLEAGVKKCALRGHDGEVTSMCTYDWSEGGATLFVSGGADGTVRVWDARQHVAVATMHDHRRRVYAVCAGPRGVIFAGDFSSTVKAHSLANPNAPPTQLPNVPGVDGCEAPIAGLQFAKLDGMHGGGLLLSTAAYFPLNDDEQSDDDDAPQGCVHVRAVDATGAGMGPMEGTSSDGYMYTLKGIEGLLTCASLSASSDGKRMRLLVGAGSGALGAYAEAGALSGADVASKDDLYPSSIEPAEDLGVEAFD